VALALAVLTGCTADGGPTTAQTLPALTSVVAVTVPATTSTVAATTTTTLAPTTTTLAQSTTAAAPVTAPVPVGSLDPASPPAVDAAAYVVYDVNSATWLADKEADSPRPVGSLMKLLTAYVVMQAGDPTHVAIVPALHVDQAESAIGLYEGERLQRDLLVRAMLIASANDAAETLAVDVGGSEDAFVEQMNAAAKALGLVNTVAANPTGLDTRGAQSSPRDLVVLAADLMTDSTFRATVARVDARLHGQTHKATNDLLTSFDGATGVKTGHTTQAGWCIIGSATRDGRSVIVAVLGAPTNDARVEGAAALMEWAFQTPT
jgi:D-alanyl-D-alanine carboxypeptidase (penicillin-binding protein 5/6)